jgi:hypothetical protein
MTQNRKTGGKYLFDVPAVNIDHLKPQSASIDRFTDLGCGEAQACPPFHRQASIRRPARNHPRAGTASGSSAPVSALKAPQRLRECRRACQPFEMTMLIMHENQRNGIHVLWHGWRRAQDGLQIQGIAGGNPTAAPSSDDSNHVIGRAATRW